MNTFLIIYLTTVILSIFFSLLLTESIAFNIKKKYNIKEDNSKNYWKMILVYMRNFIPVLNIFLMFGTIFFYDELEARAIENFLKDGYINEKR